MQQHRQRDHGPCTGGPCPTCSTVTLPPCSGSGCGPRVGSPCYAAPPASASWLTQPIPLGTSLKLTGSGDMTLYLQTTDGSTVNASICVGVYVVPGGLLTGTLPAVGTTLYVVRVGFGRCDAADIRLQHRDRVRGLLGQRHCGNGG